MSSMISKPGRLLRRIRLARWLHYWVERQFVKGAGFQLATVAALIALISLVGGALVLPVDNEGASLSDMVWWAFLRLSDPGYLGDDQGTWRRVVSTVLTVLGYVVFLGALVAIMTQWLIQQMRRLESGLTPVVARNHLVVLGWNSRTLPIVAEIVGSAGRVSRFLARHRTRRLELVVLSESVTARHAQALRDDPTIGRHAGHIVLRSGTPLLVEDLERVDCMNAAALIIPCGSTGQGLGADMATIKALLSISNHPLARHQPLPYAVAEIRDHRHAMVARRSYRGPLEVVSGNSVISRLMVQNLRNRGLSRVYGELLNHRYGNSFYLREAPHLDGVTFAAAAGRFQRAVLCGVVRGRAGELRPHLNPPDDFALAAGDSLVLVAAHYDDTEPGPARPASDRRMPLPPVPAAPEAPLRRVLILGWNRNVATLLHELDAYQDVRYQVTVVSKQSARMREAVVDELGLLGRVQLTSIEADYAVESELRAMAPQEFDNVLLASSERLVSDEEADARALVACLLLEEVLTGVAAPPQVLLELQDPDNEPLIAGRRAEVVISPLVVAHMIAQVALRRELRTVYDALFTAGGPELVLRAPADYEMSAGRWPFAELQARVRVRGELLLGSYRPSDDEGRLNPGRDADIALSPDDRLAVLAGGTL
jgi:hypothetical protein